MNSYVLFALKDYHKDSTSTCCAIKNDISKVFNSVQWSCLLNTLAAMNFPPKFIHLISLCHNCLVLGASERGAGGVFRNARDLRQGCALSPYLFVISMNVLSKLLDKAAKERRVWYHPRCKNIELTHLSFADDLVVFTDGNKRSVEDIIEVFDRFERISGLKIHMEKSTIYYASLAESVRQDMAALFPFE